MFCLIASCSKKQEPNPPEEEEEIQLELHADETTIVAGSEITFEVTADGQTVADANLHIDGNKIARYQHTFVEAGAKSVVAKKQGYKDSDPLTIIVQDPEPSAAVDIYVLGGGYDETSGYVQSLYWKNGETVVYPWAGAGYWIDPSLGYRDYRAMAVANGVVHIAGEIYGYGRSSGSVVCYMRGDEEIRYNDLDEFALVYDICAVGDDIYLSGGERTSLLAFNAVYWKNGTSVYLTNDKGANTFQARAAAIAVSGNDVHVAGEINGTPTYWKNGVSVPLEGGLGEVTDIAVADNGDVYISGVSASKAQYWKNGEKITLGGQRNSRANAIVVEDGEVYVAGWEIISRPSGSGTVSVARYWKNGEAIDLSDGSYRAEANAIAVLDGHVYVVGDQFSGTGVPPVATLWKNGETVPLSRVNHRGHASDIVVVKRSAD